MYISYFVGISWDNSYIEYCLFVRNNGVTINSIGCLNKKT